MKKFLSFVLITQIFTLIVLRGMETSDNPPTVEIKVPYRNMPLHIPLYLLRLSKKYRGATGEVDLSKRERHYTPDVVIGVFDFLKLFITSSGTEIVPNLLEVDRFFAFHQPDKLDEFLNLLGHFQVESWILDYAHKALVKIQFPSDKMVYIYPYYDLRFFTTIKDQLDAFLHNDVRTDFFGLKQEPLFIGKITHEELDTARQLLECCVVSGYIVQQLHHQQRKRVRDFFEKQQFSALHNFCILLNYLAGPPLLLTLACTEYTKRVQAMEVLDSLTAGFPMDLIRGTRYDADDNMSHFFINPIVQYIKGLIDIISIKELIEEEKPLSFAFNDQLVQVPTGIVSPSRGTMLSAWSQGGDRFFIDLVLGTVRQTGSNSLFACDVFNHAGTAMASVTGGGVPTAPLLPIVLYTVTSSSLIASPLTGMPSLAACCAFSADDTQLIVASLNGWLVMYDIKDQKSIEKHRYRKRTIRAVDCHPHDNTMIAFAQEDKVYVVYPSFEKSGEIRALLGGQTILNPDEDRVVKAHAVAFTPDGESIIVVYELPENKLCCVYYSAIDFVIRQKAFAESPLQDITEIVDVKIYNNANRYIIAFGSKKNEIASRLCVGRYGEQTFKELRTVGGLREHGYCVSLCGDVLKYITCDSNSANITFNSLHMLTLQDNSDILMRYKDPSWQTAKPYWILSAFTDDGTRLRVRTAQDKLGTLQLYSDDCIAFFDYCKSYPFSLKELHTLYHNYLAAAQVKNSSASDALARLGQGMSDEFNTKIKKCLPISLLEKNKLGPGPLPHAISVQQEQGRMARWWASIRSSLRVLQGAQQVAQGAGENQPEGQQQAGAGMVHQAVPASEAVQPAESGLMMSLLRGFGSIIMAPFRAVAWVARGIWGATLGKLFGS